MGWIDVVSSFRIEYLEKSLVSIPIARPNKVLKITCKNIKKILNLGVLVVSRLRSYLKEIAVVLDSGDTMLVGSTEFIVLRPKDGAISPDVLMVYIRSKYVQTILKWCQNGSNHLRFHEDEILGSAK